jgi:2-dehydropantoate 2-reductase
VLRDGSSWQAGAMRFVILGAGGIGGVIGGRLFQNGFEVMLIARGAHGAAIQADGLRIEDPDATATVFVPTVTTPADVDWRPDDVVVVATKSQDAEAALESLVSVAPETIAVVCATNGVEVERIALRRFKNVYGVTVMMPTAYLEPGVVQIICAPISGGLDIGRYPKGIDQTTRDIAAALSASTFVSDPSEKIMRFKYRKLVLNMGNAVEAACGFDSDAAKSLIAQATAEAEAVYVVAGIDVAAPEEDAAKRALMRYRPINGQRRGGGSTWQSVVRGGSVETAYLNGEIVLLGRLHNIATPVNELLQTVMLEMQRTGAAPMSLNAEELLLRVSP